MNSRNGISKQFRFVCVNPATAERITLDFSFKHQALEEWTKEKWVYQTTIEGVKKQKFLYFHTYFKIDWSELIIGNDSDKLQQLRNAEFTGWQILLIPHIDLPSRFFDVITLKDDSGESNDIYFNQIINHRNSPGNSGTVMTFVTKYPQHYWNIIDPSVQQSVSGFTGQEYIGL